MTNVDPLGVPDAREEIVALGDCSVQQANAYRRQFKQFERWADSHGLTALPTDENTMLLYLWSRVDEIQGPTVSNFMIAIARENVHAGHPDPRGTKSSTYLYKAKRRGTVNPTPKVDALTIDELEDVVAVARERLSSDQIWRRRAVLAAGYGIADASVRQGERVSLPLSLAARLPMSAVTVSADAVRFVEPSTGLRVLIDAAADPHGYQAIATHIANTDQRDESLTPPGTELPVIDALRTRYRTATGRAPAAPGVSWQLALASDQRVRALCLLNTANDYQQVVTGIAYILTGIVTARRSIELNRLNMADLTPGPDGYRFGIGAEEKGARISAKRGGAGRRSPHTYTIGHLQDTNGICPSVCPACALDDLVHLRQLQGAGPTDPLFVSGYGERMTSHAARGTIKRFVRDALGTEAAARFSSRTMRVTGATLAVKSGMSDADVAEHMACSIDNARRYYRFDPFGRNTSLRLTPG